MIYKGEITMLSEGRDEGRLGRTREFIEIGGTRVHNLVCSDYVNTFLTSDSGEFMLSTVKSGQRQIVMAIRRPNGELIKDKGQLSGASARFGGLFVTSLGLGIPVGFLAESFVVYLLVVVAVGIVYPAMRYSEMSKAAKALDTQS